MSIKTLPMATRETIRDLENELAYAKELICEVTDVFIRAGVLQRDVLGYMSQNRNLTAENLHLKRRVTELEQELTEQQGRQ